MTITPRVSVLMPVYNAERYVVEAIESVLSQTFGDFEFLIVDDGSTDGSRAILESYAAKDGRIRLVSRPNTGLVVALNEMLATARGEFVARMDADDVSLPDRLQRQVEYLLGHPEIVALGTYVELIDSDGERLCDFFGVATHEEIDAAHMGEAGGAAITHPTLMTRTRDLRSAGGYRAEFYPAEDTDLFLRLAEVGRLANLPRTLLQYRRHLEATGTVHHRRQVDAKIRSIASACERRNCTPPRSVATCNTLRMATRGEQHRVWAWWALNGGHVPTARKHAKRAVRLAPWSLSSWMVLACAIRGR